MVNLESIARPFLDLKVRKMYKKMDRILDKYVNKIDPNDALSIKPITGTFIYGRAPDYAGIKADKWSTEDWLAEFRRLKSFGIDTIIVQSSVMETTDGHWYIFYPMQRSTYKEVKSIKKRVKTEPIEEPWVIPSILEAAEATGIKVHLGIYSCIKGWYVTSSESLVNRIKAEQIAIVRDLLALYGSHPSLAGWYISPEIMYKLHGKALNLDMNSFLKAITYEIKKITSNLPVGISPDFTLNDKEPERIADFWRKTLRNSGIDIIYPQDAVGQLVCYPDQLETMWNFWKKIATEMNVKLWANCETFERKSFDPHYPFEACSFRRLYWQLKTASAFTEKIISWECMYFLRVDDIGAKGARKLTYDYKKFFRL